MKIAHVAIATPGRCGLYETTRELVAAERAAGVDARIVDPQPTRFHPGAEDRGVPLEAIPWAAEADVIADHSGIDVDGLRDLPGPFIYVNHGRPAASFRQERAGRAPAMSYWYRRGRDPRYKAVVTFWREHVPALTAMWSQPVTAITPPVDLERWTPEGPRAMLPGRGPHIVIADMWRDDVDPFPCVVAFATFAATTPATLHLYGVPADRRGLDPWLAILRERGQLGTVAGWVSDLAPVYRAADLLISPHHIWTRALREAMACGCRILRDVWTADVLTIGDIRWALLHPQSNPRALAEADFNPTDTARGFLDVVASVLAGEPAGVA